MRPVQHLSGSLDLLLLSVIQRRPAHGYAVISALRDQSAGAFDLPEGTVYPALHKLEKQGFVASAWDTSAGRRRRVYSLTAHGQKALAAERDAWFRFNAGVHSVLGFSA